MKTMKNKIWLIVSIAIIVIILLVAIIGSNSNITGLLVLKTPEEQIIKMGAVLPLTGSTAFAGEQIRDGMIMAVDEINAKGGINGRQVVLVLGDSKSNVQEGVAAFNNMTNLQDPVVIVSAMSSVAMAVVPLAEQNQVPVIATIASVPNLTTNEWSFRYFPTAKQEVPPIVEAANDLGVKKIGVLYLNDDFGVSMFNTLKEQYNGEVVGESFLISTSDFRTQLNKLKSEDVDAILFVGFSSHIINSIKQSKELDMNVAVFIPSTAAFKDVRSALNEMNVKAYAGIPELYRNDDSKAEDFKTQFKAKYNKDADHYATTGYDIVYLIKKSIGKSNYTKAEIKDGLSEITEFNGINGDASINGREFSFPLVQATIENGNIKYINN